MCVLRKCIYGKNHVDSMCKICVCVLYSTHIYIYIHIYVMYMHICVYDPMVYMSYLILLYMLYVLIGMFQGSKIRWIES